MEPQKKTDAVATLRRSVEAGPLYAIANATGLSTCRATFASGMMELEYGFRDGASLSVKRDESIEYGEQQVRFASPPAEDPVVVLTRAERAMFGADGCSIDWRQSETQRTDDGSGQVETVFRGEACNCQARIRRNVSGDVVGLALRSAC